MQSMIGIPCLKSDRRNVRTTFLYNYEPSSDFSLIRRDVMRFSGENPEWPILLWCRRNCVWGFESENTFVNIRDESTEQ